MAEQSLPNDEDGDGLRRLASLVSDLSVPVRLDFYVAVPDREAGEKIVAVVELCGYRTELIHDEEDDVWDCRCTKWMQATYEGVISVQKELNDLSRPLGGYSDGWGSDGRSFEP